ncbi:MAG: FecR domain-containing protein [Bacteroidales bacterium]|nr:FecR domain-containing protein [Bacteroidales bacterium]
MKVNKKYWENITAYFSNELSEEDHARIEAWAERQDGKELLMEMDSKMKQAEKANYKYTDATNKAWTKLNTRINKEEKLSVSFVSQHKNLFGIAASLLVLLSIGYGIFKIVQSDIQLENIQTAFDQKKVELSDGTIVYLNGNSSLSFPDKFVGKSRLVKLAGEAYFDVKPDKEQPFVIETERARIQVLGTSFNVRALGEENNVEVLVSSGKVRIQGVQNPEQELILEKGDFASLKNNVLQNKSINDLNYLAWKTKMLEFNNTPLKEVLQTLNRAYAVQIDLAENELGGLPLTSKYNQLDVDALLDAMCLTFNLKQKTEEDRIIIYSPKP